MQTETSEFTDQDVAELRRTKAYFPYRIVWGCIEDGKFSAYASYDKRAMNKAAKSGIPVIHLSSK